MRPKLRHLTIVALALAPVGIGSLALAQSTERWVHGSWVNLRAGASDSAAILNRLPANTPIELLAQTEDWCEVSWTAGATRGFIKCTLLGAAPLTLADVGLPYVPNNPKYSATRVFWISPSVGRLRAAGEFFEQTMLKDSVKKREIFDETRPDARPTPVRFPIPEFEAMKALLRQGVVASESFRIGLTRPSEIAALATNDEHERMEYTKGFSRYMVYEAQPVLDQIEFPAVQASLFKDVLEFAPVWAEVEQLSAQFGIKERLQILGGPQWVSYDDVKPYVAGNWDVGSVKITLASPIVEYAIGRQGLLSAKEWLATETDDITEDPSSCSEGFARVERATKRLPGYPQVKDPLLWIYTPRALPFKKANIQTSSKSFTGALVSYEKPTKNRLVSHSIDLDADGIADLLMVEVSEKLSNGSPFGLRLSFVNVAGEWFVLDIDDFDECS